MNYYPKQYTYFDKVYPRTEIDEMGKRVREFCADHDGTLWIGTEDKGLFHYYPSTGLIEPFGIRTFIIMYMDYVWMGIIYGSDILPKG